VFGPRQDPGSPYSGVISRFIKLLLAGEPPTIHGDGEQTRDFTYVDNVVDAVLAACSAPDAVGRVMNVAMGERTSLKQLLSMLSDIIGVAVEPIYLDPREGDVRDSQADCALAQEVLNYQPRVSFQEGLRRTVDWYRQSSLHS
jgi:nucleoside-diphosphate-sugar epimerase